MPVNGSFAPEPVVPRTRLLEPMRKPSRLALPPIARRNSPDQPRFHVPRTPIAAGRTEDS